MDKKKIDDKMDSQKQLGRQDSPSEPKPVYLHRNRRVEIPDGYIAVGQVVNVHGLNGEVRVEPHTDFPERFKPGLALSLGDGKTELEVVTARPHKNVILMTFVGINRREDAEALRGFWLFVSEDDAVELDEGVYWIHDLMGLAVQSPTGERYGAIVDVLSTGANDVYVVRTEAPFNKGKDLLVPAIADVVQDVDIDAGYMIVDLPPGLIEE
jgi:16S rRNA processing protein RimM